LLTGAVLSLLAGGTLVGSGASAAFSAVSASGASSWSAGTVALSATPASAIFTLSGLIPGSFGSSCVIVNYTGNLAATVRMWATSSSGSLAGYLTWQVKEGSGSSNTCSDFTPSATDYNASDATTGTLATFASAYTSYASGVGNWAPSGAASRDYEINWQLQDNNAAAGTSASLTLTWGSQNS
jgi:hypothetical protein